MYRPRGVTSENRKAGLIVVAVVAVLLMGGQTEELVQAVTGPAEVSDTAAASAVIAVADSAVGTVEGRGGATPYHASYRIADREPWCAVWVWWAFQQAGYPNLIHPRTAYTPTLAAWFRERGAFDRTPRVGDLVFFDWPGDSKARIQHVGIVVGVGADSIDTIEGNTSAGPGGSQDNGDGVWRRTRPLNSSIVGFGHPDYAAAA